MRWNLTLDGAHECLRTEVGGIDERATVDRCVGGVVRRIMAAGPAFVATTHLGASPYHWRWLGTFKGLGEAKRAVEARA